MRHRIGNELCLERGKVLHHERGQETIFTERKEVLLVQRVDVAFGVFVNDPVGNDDRTTLVGRADTIERETPRQTGDRTKERLERFREMVRDVVLVHLNHRPPRAFFVGELGFTTDTNDTRIVRRRRNQAIERLGCDRL